MPGLDMIDAFIGLIFVYLTLSLIVTAFGEAVSQRQNLRGDTLETAIRKLLGDDLAEKFYSSHQIEALKTPKGRLESKKNGNERPPSYIPDHIFCSALVDTLLQGETQDCTSNPGKFGEALERALENNAIEEKTRTALSSFWKSANYDVEQFLESIRQWFNDASDRLPGAFKRRISSRLFIIGFLVAAALNANSISMYKQLTDDPELRGQYLVKAAELAQQEASPTLKDVCGTDTECTPANVVKRQALAVMPLIGWTQQSVPLVHINGEPITTPLAGLLLWLYAIAGWLLTAAALSLGAPFWFDLLQKFVKIRGSLQALPSTVAGGTSVPAGQAGGKAATGLNTQATQVALDDFSSFKHATLGFSKTNALWLARASDLAYQEKEVVTTRLQEWGVSGDLHTGSEGTEFITLETPKLIVIAFRGTEVNKPEDIFTDARAKLREPAWSTTPEVKVHFGFHKALHSSWRVVSDAIADAVNADKPIWLCGHSLGGALAVLAAHRLTTNDAPVEGSHKKPALGALYTYGQPRCGNSAFVDELESALGNRFYRSVNNRDIVPLVPPPVPKRPYRHTGRVAYFNEFGDFILDPPLWYRALDKVVFSSKDVPSKLKETVSDHNMTGYVKLYRKLFP